MNQYEHEVNIEDLPFDLSDSFEDLGQIQSATIKCPGIYLLHISTIKGPCSDLEFYIIMNEAPISTEARMYGQKIPEHSELLLYPCEADDYFYKIIEYEIVKYNIKNNIPIKKYENLHTLSLFGMEVCPEYFGTYPIPSVTPWGYTTRYKVLIPGVFWIETDQCKTALAMSYAMRDDISDELLSLAALAPYDLSQGIEVSMGYYFFQGEIMCLVIFELMLFNTSIEWKNINEAALMNAIWTHFPKYAAEYNLREQCGENDNIGKLLKFFNPDHELYGSVENMICLTPDVGLNFFCFE